MRSCDIHNLQFDTVEDEELRSARVVPGSCRLVCPICGHQHTEEDRDWLSSHGEYVHKVPSLIETNPSYQCGVLASTLKSLNWEYIAQQQLYAGKTSELSTQQSFDNSIRGLPWKQRKVTIKDLDDMRKKHLYDKQLRAEDIEMLFMTADTMDDFVRWCVFAWDINDCLHLVDEGGCAAFLPTPSVPENKCLCSVMDRQWYRNYPTNVFD